jgi:hypothetical protein
VCDNSEDFVVEVGVAEQSAVCEDLEELGDWMSVFVEAEKSGTRCVFFVACGV